jgi:hypothetical protein
MITIPPMKTIITSICWVLVLAVSAGATNYTVKSSGGGNYTTIQACANVAVAGDTCTVFAGSYAGWTQTASGTSGSPITFTVNPGDAVNITSGVNVTNASYITIGAPDAGGGCSNNATSTGAGGGNPSFNVGGCFVFQNSGIQGPTCASGNHTNYFHFAYNTSRGSSPNTVINFMQSGVTGQAAPCGTYTDSTSNNNYFGHNNVNWNIDNPAAPFCNYQILLYGNNNLVEYNDMQGTGAQHLVMGGSYNLARDNYFHDDNGNVSLGCGQSPEHMDFFFSSGGSQPAPSFSVVERGAFENCTNDGENCKFAFARTGGTSVYDTSDTMIIRYNYVQGINGSLAGPGDQNDGANTTPNWHMYNNTVATGDLSATDGETCGTFDSGIGTELNTICYNTQDNNGYTPIYFFTQAGSFSNGDEAYLSACGSSCTWNNGSTAYTSEATYSRLANKNPNFANYPTDGTLSSGSPALAGGVNDTTVRSGCGSTSLVVADARFFSAGFGPTSNLPSYASVPPGDVIRVDSSTYQLTAINYTSNTLTTATSVSCSTGDPVSLYQTTDGTVVFPLNQAAPNVGAFGSTSSGAAPAAPNAPTGLSAVVK